MKDRLARGEKPKTHKERVQEFNTKLSRLSEHNDMYVPRQNGRWNVSNTSF